MKAWKRSKRFVGTTLGAHPRIVIVSALLLLTGMGLLVCFAVTSGPPESSPGSDPSGPLPPAPRPTTPVAFDDGCVSRECHAIYSSAEGVHAPVAEGACEGCHSADVGDHTYPAKRNADSLCRACHDVDGRRSHQHGAQVKEGCLACHDSHQSEAPFLLVAPTVARTCELCHLAFDGASQHGPYESGYCTVCHEPHESEFPMLLRFGSGVDHCRTCHPEVVDSFTAGEGSHVQVEGGCLGCHGAHATDYDKHLTRNVEDQCLACHEDVKAIIAQASVPHAAALEGDRCLSCHDPHASGAAKLLRADQARVCLGCHQDPVEAEDGRTIPAMTAEITDQEFAHGPVAAGDCSSCHGVHGARNARLLKEEASTVLRGRFDIANYTLCFQCHTPDLVLAERTTIATWFRNGDQNLHYLHIQNDKLGRTCTSCHAVHGSPQPRHIADYARFDASDWNMPIGFVLREDGGTCTPGCHEELPYLRGEAPRNGSPEAAGVRP